MSQSDPVALLREVLDVLSRHGLDAALIGAGALAVHGYIRATADLDVAVTSDLATLRAVASDLRHAGASVAFDEPDADDHLGGVLTVTRPDVKPVQVVNFVNEKRARNRNPGRASIDHRFTGRTGLPTVDLPHLVALKLWAGGPKSVSDVVGLLEANPDADLAAIEAVCTRFDLIEAWRPLRPGS